MGCIHACQCGGLCLGCNAYEPERYYGHAEDLAAQASGYDSYDSMLQGQVQKGEES